MTRDTKVLKLCLAGLLLVAAGLAVYSVAMFGKYLFESLEGISTRETAVSDYTKVTTPLPVMVAKDLCAQFAISATDRRCRAGAVVYGPDFFPEIKSYFRELPRQEATYSTAQRKLGRYSKGCGKPNVEGRYSCRYDLRGDGTYWVTIFFDQKDYIYQVIADTGGS